MLILDYDGNLTDVEQEGAPFTQAYAGYVGKLIATPPEDMVVVMQALTEVALQQDPANFGWRFGADNLIMAPAQVDPYLRANASARKALQASRVFSGPRPLNAFLDLIFGFAYGKTANVPKPETQPLLMEIAHDELPAWIVSNSGTSGVKNKLATMFGGANNPDYQWWFNRTFGNARKMDPDECVHQRPDGSLIHDASEKVLWNTDTVQQKLFSGFPRETIIKRPHYLKRLLALRERCVQQLARAVGWSEVLVVGDIFELDLALPLMLGCHIGFMTNEHTPEWEASFVKQHPRGRLMRTPAEILPYYREIQSARTT